MSIEIKNAGKLVIIIPTDRRFNLSLADEIKSTIFDLISKGQKRFLINFNHVESIDSAGLGVLISIGQKIQLIPDGSLSFCQAANTLLDIFEIINLKQFFTIYSDEAKAIDSIVSRELQQKKIAYVGTNDNDYQKLKKSCGQQLILDKTDRIYNDGYDGYLIEEAYFKLGEILDKPFVILVPGPVKMAELRRIKGQTGAHNLVETPFGENEAKVLITELLQYEPVKPTEKIAKLPQQLFEQYTSSLQEKLQAIEELIEQVIAHPDQDTVEKLKAAIHKLSGSAGTYGYVKAGEICKQLEQKLAICLQNKVFEKPLLNEIQESFAQMKFYFGSTFYKDLSKRNIAVRPIQNKSAFIISPDKSVISLFTSLATDLNLTIEIEMDPERVIQHLKELEFKPEIIIIELRFNNQSTDGLDLIKSIKNSLLATGIKFGILVEQDNFEINMRAAIDGVRFIIKKPISLKDINAIFKTLTSTQLAKPYKVLVVDDDIDICNFIKSSIDNENIHIQATTDEKKILEHLYEFRPNLLLLDINLKSYDGWSVLSALRKDLRYQDLKTIIITSTSDPQALKQLHTDCDDVWVKPLDKEQLQSKIMGFAEANAATMTENKLSSFKSLAEFKKLMNTLAVIGKGQTNPFILAVFGANEYAAIVHAGHGAEEEYLISSENLFSSLIKGDCLRGYLEKGRFAFLFCDQEPGQVKEMLSKQIKELDFKIMLNGRNEDIFITFSEVDLTFMPGSAPVDDLLSEVLANFEKTQIAKSKP